MNRSRSKEVSRQVSEFFRCYNSRKNLFYISCGKSEIHSAWLRYLRVITISHNSLFFTGQISIFRPLISIGIFEQWPSKSMLPGIGKTPSACHSTFIMGYWYSTCDCDQLWLRADRHICTIGVNFTFFKEFTFFHIKYEKLIYAQIPLPKRVNCSRGLACTIFSPIFTVCFINLKKVVKQQGEESQINQLTPGDFFFCKNVRTQCATRNTSMGYISHGTQKRKPHKNETR